MYNHPCYDAPQTLVHHEDEGREVDGKGAGKREERESENGSRFSSPF